MSEIEDAELVCSGDSMSDSKRISITALMTALALVGNYTFVAVPNVELGSLVLFLTAYIFGIKIAGTSTLIMSVVYGTINPWGAFIPEIWIAQVIGWLFMVVAGAIIGQDGSTKNAKSPSPSQLAGVGFFVTLFFDLLTNLAYSWAFFVPYLLALVGGAPFMAIHVISNSILFGLAIPKIEPILRETLGVQIWGVAQIAETE